MANTQRVTTTDIRARVRARHGDAVVVTDEFAGWQYPLAFRCTACDHSWSTRPQNVCDATGCPECSKVTRRESISRAKLGAPAKLARYRAEIEQVVERHGLVWQNPGTFTQVRATYGAADLWFHCTTCGHEWDTTFRAIRADKGCPACAQIVRLRASKAARIRTNEEMDAKLAVWSGGLTSLASDWLGSDCDREYQCRCGVQWIVPAHTKPNMKVCCPTCSRARCHSPVSTEWIEREARRRRITIQHARNGGEYRVPGTRFKVDGYHARTKTIYEFYGDCWHGNPALYKPRSRPHPWRQDLTAKQLYTLTMQREHQLRLLGYRVVSIWEHDYRARN